MRPNNPMDAADSRKPESSPNSHDAIRAENPSKETKGTRSKNPYVIVAILIPIMWFVIIILTVDIRDFPDPYEHGQRTPEQVRTDITRINSLVEIECLNRGFNNPEWTCPKISQNQAISIISKLISNFVGYHRAGVKGQHLPEETAAKLNTEINRALLDMKDGECLSRVQIRLHDGILSDLEIGGFLQGCNDGWRLARSWHEVISRQSPQPTPNQEFYRRHLPEELLR